MKSYMIDVRLRGQGPFAIGVIEAESPKAAQEQVKAMLETGGISNDRLTLDVTSYQTITVMKGVEILISPAPTIEKWIAWIAKFPVL